MLRKTERLSRTNFAASFARGARRHTPHLTLIHHPHPTFHGSVVVGKKVHKQATVRNKLRRQVYGLLSTHLKQRGFTGVVIVVVKPSFLTLTRMDRLHHLKAQIEQLTESAYNNRHV